LPENNQSPNLQIIRNGAMMLALVGSGEYLPEMEAVDRFLLKHLPSDPQVICLPTAAGKEGDERIHYWSELGMAHFRRLGAYVSALPVIDSASANNRRYTEQIAQANLIYFSGGKPEYLHQVLSGSLTWQAVKTVLGRGGVVAGCSAGAMIMGARIPGLGKWQPGFGLVQDAVIVPHYDEIPSSFLSGIKLAAGRQSIVIGIEGFTALIRDGEKYIVRGMGAVHLPNHPSKKRYVQGDDVPIGETNS
jgi:cyanophycinase